jgi:A/G-specific adenine glycosylase
MLSTKSNDDRKGSRPRKGTHRPLLRRPRSLSTAQIPSQPPYGSGITKLRRLREPLSRTAPLPVSNFRKIVWTYYREHGRDDLEWRKTTDPYKILVSEVMLQQTQVDRVRPYYKDFLKKFPTVKALAAAPLADVLIVWQGLGYNRRAKMLHEAAKAVVETYKGTFPKSVAQLEELSGVGPYTARAVAAFAYNQDVVFIETNLRTVVTHHFFNDKKQVADKEILAILTKAFPKAKDNRGSREWYAALMDYGAHLKRSGIRINAKSKTYVKQSVFRGSARQARGLILKTLVSGPCSSAQLTRLLGTERRDQLKSQLILLTKEGLIELKNKKFQLPQ